MSISERERQALDSIEDELAHSAPRLAAKLAMFARLAADERMPAREPVRSVAWKRGGWAAAGGRAEPCPRGRWHIGRKTRVWLWLASIAAALGLMVTLTHGTTVSACVHSLTPACAQAPSVYPASYPAPHHQNGR